ncbi:Trk system potassium transporter TrkA [Natrialba aegyptia]
MRSKTMRILIVGAGDVGTNIAHDLADSHAVTVIDRDSERIDALTADAALAGVVGDGRSVGTLDEAGLSEADIVVASTDSDSANVMVCNAAKEATDPHTIARVKDVGLYRAWQSFDKGLGVDAMLCIDLLAARSLVRSVVLPGAKAVDTFADGTAEVAEFDIGAETPISGQSVAEADQYPSVTFAAIIRDGELLIPNGETVIKADDCLVVIGSTHGVSRFAKDVSDRPTLQPDDDIVIAGGDSLGYNVARLFEDRGFAPEVIEHDPERVSRLANQLGTSTVVEADATDVDGFARDHLTEADLLVGTVDDDTNYLLAKLARELGVEQTVEVVDNRDVIDLFESTGLDVVVHPQDIVAGEILQTIYEGGSEKVAVLEHDEAEVLEIEVDEESLLAGSTIQGADSELPQEFVVGAVIRGGTLRTPRGGTVIQTGDRVIAFMDAAVADEISSQL